MSKPGQAGGVAHPIGKPGEPCAMVIFGAAGDLTRRKLVPALVNLASYRLLPQAFAVVGVARRPMSTDEFRAKMADDVKRFAPGPVEAGLLEGLLARMHYLTAELADPTLYPRLAELLAQVQAEHGTTGNIFYYLATSPELFAPVVAELASNGLMRESEGRWRRVIVEKPFGADLESARALNAQLLAVADERQIYRIDHYLGKETVQNILALRFANGIFEPIWNRRYIDHVQISVAETVGVEQRGNYYDRSGALRDMVPNHIMQLISLIAMEPPISFQADAVRDEQSKVLRAIQPLSDEDVLARTVRGQYAEGELGGSRVAGYRAETHVDPRSRTETFVAMKLLIDNWRWADVPFYLRTGKRLPARNTHIVIQFRRAPFVLFRNTSVDDLEPNQLVLHIQPEEGISLRFAAKQPGPVMRLGSVDMDFEYAEHFGKQPSTGYERLLLDCMIGDATLFQRADMVDAGWGVVSTMLDVWKALPPRSFPNYAAGSWGPREAEELIERDGRR
jgi:glucose-6-phosphate 1-dehydrogenase